jgi:hypothetical protein
MQAAVVQLDISQSGAPTGLHLTVALVQFKPEQWSVDRLQDDLQRAFGASLGAANLYSLKDAPVAWGRNSYFVDFTNADVPSLDADVRTLMFRHLAALPNVVIFLRRHASSGGLAPQHVDTKGVPPTHLDRDITFAIHVRPFRV